MTREVVLTIPDDVFRKAQQIATTQSRRIEDVLADSIALKDTRVDDDWSEPDKAFESEMQAYIAMHGKLKRTLFGQYVAVHGGKLVDKDTNYSALVERVRANYPDTAVWMSRVDEEPMATLTMRSPRIVRE